MKIFLSFKFTGENLADVTSQNNKIRTILEKKGHSVYNSLQSDALFDKENYSYSKRLEYFFNELESCDAVLAFIRSVDKSEGMLLEIGYALSIRKPLILAIKNNVSTVFLREIAHKIIEFETFNELLEKLEKENL